PSCSRISSRQIGSPSPVPIGRACPARVVTTEPLTAIAAVGAAAIVADASFGGAMRVIPLDGGAAGAPFETTLWGVTSLRRGVGGLYVGGHDYGMAAIERRDPGAPAAVADLWDPLTVEGWVRGLAAASTGDLAAVGDAWLLVLDGGDLAAGPRARLDQPVRAAAWTASGAYLAVAVDGRVTLWDRDLVAEVAGFDVPDPVALAVDPSGERLIVASGDGHLRALSCR
ncbi:MAG: hypothetical protein KC464_19320, partial [Myxococcales bacterium]|nr:hypothetical protein [Myxococcales bacterium]